jgi:beta-xylosidase
LSVFADTNGKVIELPIQAEKIYLKIKINSEQGKNQFYYSTDNEKFTPLGETFIVSYGNWKGPKIGLFSYNEKEKGGTAKFGWFRYMYE